MPEKPIITFWCVSYQSFVLCNCGAYIYMCVCAYISNFLKQSQDHTLFLLFVLHFSFNIISWAFLYILKKSIETFCNCSITFLCNIFNHCPIFGYLGYNKFLLLLMLKWVYKIFVHIVLFYLYLPKQWNCWHILLQSFPEMY